MKRPQIIQGGMGVGISSWRLAKAVSKSGQLGVVSGTALDTTLIRLLQDGDPKTHLRRAIQNFPLPWIGEKILDEYYRSTRRSAYQNKQMLKLPLSVKSQELLILSNFVEVFLAKENHSGIVGINYLEKIQLATLPSLYGAMLAGVDYVLIGAGIPREIPGALDLMSKHEKAELSLSVAGLDPGESFTTSFDPREFNPKAVQALKRPEFLAIISSVSLAMTLKRKATGRVDGFIIEAPIAGGHNAPPRGPLQLNEKGEPLYSERDEVDLQAIKKLETPFWLAGGYGDPESLQKALKLGAEGIQAGSAFALCKESGLSLSLKKKIFKKLEDSQLEIFTDPHASPTRFPFKVVRLEGTLSEPEIYEERTRVCDLGYLRQLYKKEDGNIGYRCPAEPVDMYLKKGGDLEDTKGRKCLCNSLVSNIDLAQTRKDGSIEKELVTLGNEAVRLQQLFKKHALQCSAHNVVQYILGKKKNLVQENVL